MVNKCAAYGCKSGYKTKEDSTSSTSQDSCVQPKLTFHAFPLQDKDLCDKWIRANPRKDFTPTKYSKLCSLHFKLNDFVSESRDSNKQRHKSGNTLSRRYLKKDAVPSVFPNAPEYLSSERRVPRSTSKATASSRLEHEAQEMEQMEQSFLADDDISQLSISEISDRLRQETTLPSGFTITLHDQNLFAYIIEVTGDGIPKIAAAVTLKTDRTVVLSIEGKIIPASQLKDLTNGSIINLSQLVNLMARVKSFYREPHTRSLELLVLMAVQCLKDGMSNIEDKQSTDYRKLSSCNYS